MQPVLAPWTILYFVFTQNSAINASFHYYKLSIYLKFCVQFRVLYFVAGLSEKEISAMALGLAHRYDLSLRLCSSGYFDQTCSLAVSTKQYE